MVQKRQFIDDDNIYSDDFSLTENFGLSDSDLAIAELYRGGIEHLTGNKKRCYMALHPNSSERTAEKRASELFKKESMVRYLAIKSEQLAQKADINAEQLLKDSRRLMHCCLGDKKIKTGQVVDGQYVESESRIFDASGARGAIDLQGKLIGAFTDRTELTGKDGKDLLPTSIEVIYVEPLKNAG